MADEINLTNPSSNQILVYDETQQAFVNVEPDLDLFGNTTYIQGGMNLGQSDGEHIFNNVVSNTLRFRRIRGNDGIVLTSSGSYIDISFDGDATTLQGLNRSGFLEKGNNLSDANAQDVRNNIDVYSKSESDSSFMFADANNIPDADATYDIGANGRRYADMYAVTFHGLATEAVVSQTLERMGAQNGEVLTWDSSEGGWTPKASTSTRLSELVDVELNNIQHESVLVYNGIRNIWESAPLSSLGVSSGGDGGSAGTITDAENVGNGVGTFFARFGGNLQFRSVTGGSNVTVNTNFNNEEIVIDADVPQSTDGLTEGNNNLYFTSQRVRDTLGTVSIQDLGSVSETAPVSGQAPVWNGTEWVFTDVAANVSSTDDIPEGTTNLYYDSQRVYTDIGEYLVDINYGIPLNEISDVDAIQSAGTFLYSDGSRWNNREILLSDISDVSLTGLSDGSTIVYNSGTGEFQVGQLPENLIDLGETTDSLHFNSISFDSFFTQKTTDDLSETSQNRFLNTTNLVNALQNISINSLTDVDTTGVSDSNVLVWSSSQSAFVPADSSSLNVTVNMGIEDLNNVNESSVLNAQDGYGLVYNSISGDFEFTDLAQSLSSLSDVSASGIANGEVLVYQSGTFVPQGILPYDANTTPTDGDILQFNSVAGRFESVAGGNLGVENLGDLLDVTITSITDGQIVVYDGALSQYVNKDVSDSIALASLSDVSASSITTGQALIYDGVGFSAQDVLPYELTTPLANQILSYDDVNSRFVNTDPNSVLGIDTTNSEDGDVLVYNGTNSQYESAAWALYVSEENTPVDNGVYTLRWSQADSEYLISPVSDNVTVSSLSDVVAVDQSDGSGLFFNNTTGNFEIKKVNIQSADDLSITSISDGDAIIWDSANGQFINGTPQITVEELTNVSDVAPVNGDSIVWNGTEYVKAKVELSYDEIVKVTNAYEYWNFDGNLTGTINSTSIVPDSGYTVNYGIGVKGSESVYSGTTYDISSGSPADTFTTTIGGFDEANAGEFSYDFWYKPTTNVAYLGTPEEATVAKMEIVADNLGSEYINLEMVITPFGGSFVHEIKVIKNGVESGRYPLDLNSTIYNHIVVNYRKNGTNTEVDVYVNTIKQIDQTLAVAIDSDITYTVTMTLLEELETGSQAYSIDNLAFYDSVQTENVIERKYNNIVTNGFAFTDPSVFSIDGIELSSVGIGDTLIYDGSNYVNQPIPVIPEDISDLNDVDTTGITSGQVLQYNGTNFVPFTITDQIGATILDELGDVDTTTIAPTSGDTLVFDGTNFIPQAPSGGGASAINDLTDVDTTGITSGQVLQFDGTNFVPTTITVSEGSSIWTEQNWPLTSALANDNNSWETPSTLLITDYSGMGGTQLVEYTEASGFELADGSTFELTFEVDDPSTNTNGGELEVGFFDINDNKTPKYVYFNTTDAVYTVSIEGSELADNLKGISFFNSFGSPNEIRVTGAEVIAGPLALDGLDNVDTTGVALNNVLKYDGTNWVDGSVDYTEVTGTPSLSTVATSGSYTDLLNQPTIPSNIEELGNVDTTGITSGQVLQFDGTNFVPFSITDQVGATILDELGDVDTTTTAPTSGQALVFDGTNFVPQTVSGGGVTTIEGLNNVDTTGVALNNVLKYDGTNWVDGSVDYSEVTGVPSLATVATSGSYTDLLNQPTIPSNIEELGNVDTTGITSGQALVFDGTNFVPQTVSGGASAVSDLTDVDTTGAALNNVLKYDGTNWVDGSVDYSEVTGTPTLSTVATSGSYTDLLNQPTIPANVNDLTDVDTTGITSGQALVFDGTNFVPQTVSGGASVVSDLTDVDTTGVALNNVLKYDGTNWVDGSVDYSEVTGVPSLATVATSGSYNDLSNLPALSTVATTGDYTDLTNTPAIPSVLDNLGDVDTTTTAPTSGQALVFDGTNFVPQTVSGSGATQLDELNDVVISTPADNQFLRYDGTNFVNETVNIVSAASDLSDVDTTGAVSGNLLKYNGTIWVSDSVDYSEITSTPSLATVATTGAYSDLSGTPTLSTVATSGSYTDLLNQPTIPSNVEDLGNVDTTGVALNNVLKYDGTNWVDGSVDYSEVTGTPSLATVATSGSYNDLSNLPVLATVATSGSYTDLANLPSIPSAINDLTDVDTTGITSGQVLQFDGTNFVATTISGGGASTLNDLTDVDTTTTAPTTGDTLVYDGTEWVPQAPAAGGSGGNFEWVEFLFSSGAGGSLNAGDAIQSTTSGINVNIVDGANGIVEFSFNGKSYPPISIMSYGHATGTNEFNMNSIQNYGTRKVSGGGTITAPALFSGTYNETITLELTMATTGSSAGFGERAYLYVMFIFGE